MGKDKRQHAVDAAERSEVGGNLAMRIVECAEEHILKLFHTPTKVPYAVIALPDGHVENWPVRSTHMAHWLALAYHQKFRRLAGANALKDAIAHMAARAVLEGEQHPIFTRIAHHNGNIYIDLVNSAWEAIEITANGWNIIKNPPIMFRRSRGMQPLAQPTRGGSLDALRALLNIESRDTFRLAVAWLLAALRPHGPYPLLVLQGEQRAASPVSSAL